MDLIHDRYGLLIASLYNNKAFQIHNRGLVTHSVVKDIFCSPPWKTNRGDIEIKPRLTSLKTKRKINLSMAYPPLSPSG